MFSGEQAILVLRLTGVTFDNRQSLIKDLHPGDVLELKNVKNNAHDENAIAVIDVIQRQIGWIPMSHSKYVKELLENYKLETRVLKVLGGGELNFGIEIVIKTIHDFSPFIAENTFSPKNELLMSALTSYSNEELKDTVNNIYSDLCESFGRKTVFGPSGAKEFIGALVLANVDEQSREQIILGIQQYFKGSWRPLEFSNFMDEVVTTNSSIDYAEWSKAYRFLESNHLWIMDCSFVKIPAN